MLLAFFLAGTAAAQSKIYYVSSQATDTGDGSSWANATTLTKALDKAVAGDQIWVQGFDTLTGGNLYVAPKEGFAVKSGVQLYGGFAGTESRLSQRVTLGKPYQLKYRSVLSGDIQQNDTVGSVDLIFPANGTRSDNATHVLSVNLDPTQASGNNNTYPTVINGFSIGNGQAAGTGDAGKGGGIYVYGDNSKGGVFRIERCFLISNYATQGGAVYVSSEVQNVNNGESLINQCVIYNNAAGDRAAVENQAGGIYLAGKATVVNTSIFNNGNGGVRLSPESKVVNVTIARNTGAGVDMTAGGSGDAHVYNSIIWGNTQLYLQNDPGFRNSAYHEVVSRDPATPDENGNIYVAKENRGDKFGPMFDAPSVKTSYDRDFNWRESAYPLWSWNVLEGSVMIDKGHNDYYDQNVYGSEDMAGNPRISGDRISVGAYEYQYLPATRIRYVKPTATGTGDGSSWDNASGDLQKMIDDLADNNVSQQAGEVWVAAGTYKPQSQLISGMNYSASFRMRDGISVYGGFEGDETSKQERAKGTMPWDFTNVTVLEAAYYESKLAWTNSKWTVGSDSRHVVWFAPMSGESDFTRITTLDGVTVQGGYAQGNTGLDDFKTDCGGGVYMDGANAYLSNCIVRENYATGNGGGVYLKNGRVQTSLIYNNNADADGGAVYVENRGLVYRSMLTNNSALNGAGVYLYNGAEASSDDPDHPEYLILSTCVVSNNTVRGNGAVYCDKGGVLMQNTITNNECVTATDATDVNASQTGGIYVDEYALVLNSVLWNNQMQGSGINIPMYARNPSAAKVRFLYNAISGVNNAVWNNTLQEQTLSLVDENAGKQDDGTSIGPRFTEPAADMNFSLNTDYGVQDEWKDGLISYYWKPISGSNLWARGMALGQLPSEVVLSPELDIEGKVYAQKPAVGAFSVGAPGIKHATVGDSLVVYVDVNCTEPDHDGSSWATGFRSLNNAISYLAGLDADTVGTKKLVVRVLEGDIWPRYAFTNNDPKTATITVPVTTSGQPVYLYGGYHRTTDNNTVIRDPLTYRSIINGNTEGKDITQGLYHCITVERGAKLVLDGFHVINGYAAGEASRQYGAGLLAHAGSEVTVRNCIFENNTAQEGAAIDAREATLTMENCVVNNNTNTENTSAVINSDLGKTTMHHVTIVNNIGAAVVDESILSGTSFSKGNTSKNSIDTELATKGADGAKNFANPTNTAGATLGFDTYFGGYSSFRPLTSSDVAANLIINKVVNPVDGLSNDIMNNERNLGGVPDLGAYEADLPKAGMVIYVRDYGVNDLSTDGRDGSSWSNAINGRANYGREDGIEHDDITDLNVYTDANNFYITGLQYAVNQAYLKMVKRDEKNDISYQSAEVPGNKSGTNRKKVSYPILDEVYQNGGEKYNQRIEVWVGAGEYVSNTGLFMRDGVDVYGGFPSTGNPGESDRNPNNNQTILKAGKEGPKLKGNGDGDSSMAYYDLNESYENANKTRRVLTQPMPYYGFGENGLDVERTNKEVTGFKAKTTWNGFVITGGRTHINHQREGGAGVALRQNSVLENCVIKDNINSVISSGRGGIFCNGGTLINCRIEENQLVRLSGTRTIFGGGIYLRYGTTYNCVYVKNKLADTDIYSGCDLGSAIYIECGNFYNNTVADNSGSIALGIGKYFQESQLNLINCIIYNNTHPAYNGSAYANTVQIGRLNQGSIAELSITNCCIPEGSVKIVKDSESGYGTYVYNTAEADQNNLKIDGRITSDPKLVNPDADNYELSAESPCINAGKSDNLYNEGNVVTLPSTDMNYTNRIKDCTIDIGAYERDNQDNVEPDANGYYYVNQNGAGTANGSSPTNVACAMKLQEVLNAAGERAKKGLPAIVKVAGYEDASFVYNANTLASAIDPQSYTYVIPEGVTLMGGYYDGNYNDGDYEEGSGWDDATGDNMRNPMKFRTVLSAIAKPSQGSTITQEVNGYHTVTFGAWPGTAALTKSAIIDGVWLEDGSATSLAGAGNPNTRGGGAIVPSGAHVRNCVVRNCAATEGGGLYLMPGATVSGTLIMDNSAENGGGVYADSTNVKADSRAHILSSTIAGNTAFTSGGGLYMEDGAVMNVNTVIFGNTAGSDKNVSGVTNTQFADNKLSSVYGIDGKTNFYPFNDCFVETQEMPSDFENTRLESDSTLYFTGDFYQLKDYSLLIKHGLKNEYQEKETQADPSLVTTFNVAKSDMQNIVRVQTGNAAERLDAGAFAYEGGILPTELFTRIFVSQTTNVTLPEGSNMSDYLGRSFYTSFSTLEDALGYIRSMRDKGHNDNFEILVAGGTYKPSNERTTTAPVTHDQRLYSFEVPQGVSIYGGFVGTEFISSKVQDGNDLTTIPGVTGTFTCMGDITDILNARTYSDFNQNGINEPWELANQTILSGQINASSTAQNAYHVVFTDKGTATTVNPVVLDGLTVMNGETDNQLSISTAENEQGRGGGIYSNGVTYTISRCRLLNNTAVRGGAVFVRDADLNLSGCILAGNKTVYNDAKETTYNLTSRGGAAYVSGISKEVNLRAVNTLWANNESAEEGGAIGTNYAEGISSQHDPLLYIMNNTFVRNKATTNPVLYNHNAKSELVNTLIWGNVGETYQDLTDLSNIYDVSHCASDVDYIGKFATGNSNNNILLSIDNMGDKGPRFANPTTEAGEAGNSSSSLWNPVAISVVTDAGDGTEHTATKNPDETDAEHKSEGNVTGAYQQWFTDNAGVTVAYMTNVDGTYVRYSGPRNENNNELCKPIDIGLYEYQYVSNFSTMPSIYVATLSAGNGSGDSWANATDDLRGAIVGASNPTVQAGTRRIFVRDGKYTWSRLSAGSAYILNMSDNSLSDSLILKGSCTGSGEQQDFSKPTVVRNDVETRILMSVTANGKDVVFEGFTFANHSASETAKGMEVSVLPSGSLTLKNCGFRQNPVGLNVAGNSGPVLIYNTLFADGGTGLAADERTTVVNATFVQNTTDLTGTPKGIYNSVAWKNGTQNLTTDTEKKNVAILGTVDNDNVLEGPNFVDPDNADMMSRDYRIRPNLLLLNKGNKKHYTDYALGLTAADAAIPADEKDLANNARLTGDEIDVGAYEYEATLKPIVYVKADLTGTADGNSWTTALGDLQGAVDLAGIYVNGNPGEHAYVFVHNNYRDAGPLNLSMPGVKVYGGMNDETSAATDVSGIVSDLLTQRKGMLESTGRSWLQDVTLGTDVVVDGFVVNGAATVNNGILSTSILNGAVEGKSDGVLYNSLALNGVSGVKAVNVTATGTIADVTGSGNNRTSVSETNAYVTDDYWKYQLMETDDANLDKGTEAITQTCIDKVGHSRDLIGNQRIRNAVDNGCFETWNITGNYTITSADKPVGKSVVYVRKEQELQIQKADDGSLVYPAGQYFSPGYLLLEHHAGLRGCGNYINLTNFAVERDVKAGGNDLTVMPFDVKDVTPNAGYSLKRYNGSTRAAYYFTFDSTNGNAWTDGMAWTDQDFANRGETEGFLIEDTSAHDIKVRFSGTSYTEGGEDKSVVLMKYNFNEPWNSTSTGGNRFTHKENMSWNLFGSPYLCAMYYGDMEYGRVLYGYVNRTYQTVNTAAETTAQGFIPAGDAVFTQTATLKENETFTVGTSAGRQGDPYASSARLQLTLSPAEATRATADEAPASDMLQLNAVPADEARQDFDLGADGVKWMSTAAVPQLYAVRSGNRYSLLSAVSEEGETALGVTAPKAGVYQLGIAGNEGYETVELTDHLTGRTVDLTAAPYTFTLPADTCIDQRFTLRFRTLDDEGADGGIRIRLQDDGSICVSGLEPGQRIQAYSVGGQLEWKHVATESQCVFRLQRGVHVVEVREGGTKRAVSKLMVP
jgi:hypothetical protein